MMTAELLTSILQIMETKMDRSAEDPKMRKKVSNVLVECLQNLFHHIDDDIDNKSTEFNERNSLFMITKSNTCYTINTGNYMKSSDVAMLQDKLDLINSLSKEKLKDFYKQVLNDGTMSVKGTAGLGMIDIARKSGQKLEYCFSPINYGLTFFSLSVKIDE
jgi:hypothetical protein